MTTLVVDANVVVQAALESAGLGRIAAYELIAPPIMPSEAVSTLHEMRFRREISAELARIALDRLAGFAYEVRRPPELAPVAWRIADSLGWAKTYDAEYVALAQLVECRLVTLDARLARGAGRLVEVVGPADL